MQEGRALKLRLEDVVGRGAGGLEDGKWYTSAHVLISSSGPGFKLPTDHPWQHSVCHPHPE